MIRTLISLALINIPLILCCQNVPDHPDLGLHGLVTWFDSTHIRVEYDWADDSQLSDWITTNTTTLVRGNGFVTVTNGISSTSVWAMIWKQGIKCSRIIAEDAAPLSDAGHLNFYSNLTSFTGTWLPNPGFGAVLATSMNFWTHDGVKTGDMGAPFLVVGVARDYEYTASTTGMTIKSSVDNVVYSYNAPCVPVLDRKIALGGWAGNTKWGKLIIEGEVTIPWQYEPVPPDVINIQSSGAMFAPVIEVVGTPVIEWIFDDSTTSASTTPLKDYGSPGSRHNFLKVTPWSALTGINVGYDASDGGYGGFDMVANQNVLGFQNLNLAKSSLQYLCASYNPVTELDLKEFTALKFVELFECQYLETVRLGSHLALERLCVEDCDLDSLDLSGCAAIEDLRAALNNYTSINWGSVGQLIWHICIRDNPQMTENLPALTQFPVLRDLWNWNTNQTGAFVCHSPVIQSIRSYDNHYTSADLSGCTGLRAFSLSGSQLALLDLGNADNLIDVQLKDCGLAESQVDYSLHTLDLAGRSGGYLDLTGNAAPSAEGLVHYDNLINRGWTIDISMTVSVTDIIVTGAEGATTITTDDGTLQLSATVFPAYATDTTITWSIVNGTGQAAITSSGLVTAVDNGTVLALATANDESGVYGTLIITISNQVLNSSNFPFIIGKIIVNSNEIRVLVNSCFISWKADLYNLQGILISSQIVESDILIFDVSTLPSGIYIIVLSKGENIRVANVIKP